MDAVKRASFATKQVAAGPAPLASFEDLPSDELDSPEDSGTSRNASVSKDDPSFDNESTSECNTVYSTNTPDTFPTSNLSTPQIESDYDSHCTLTPVDGNNAQSSFRTGSLSSLPKEDDSMLKKQKKGSVMSLGSYEMIEGDINQRKSSWTDIFRTHNPSTKDVSEQSDNSEIKSKSSHTKKKHRSDLSKKDNVDGKSKDRGKFLGIFKTGKKSGKNIDPTTPECLKITSDTKNILKSIEDDIIDTVDMTIDEGKENEQPKKIELHPIQMQNDLDKSTPTTPDTIQGSTGSKENDMRNNLNIAEKEYNIFSSQSEETCEKAINIEKPEEKEVEVEHETLSSGSELTLDGKEPISERNDDDFEKENLLSQDLSEIEDDVSVELPVPSSFVPQSKLSRQQRLEVVIVPIDRPRSTTPINVAALEAFVHCASPTIDTTKEKIKLTLPGEQFCGRMKSPKRTVAKNWGEFCEEGLHSPHMQKKRDGFRIDSQDDIDSKSGWDAFNVPDKPWVTFDTKADHQDTPDLFKDLPIKESRFDSKSSDQEIIKCSCECHAQGCENIFIQSNELSSPTGSEKIDVFSDNCQCQCHERFIHLWSPSTVNSGGEHLTEICDTLKSTGFSTDFVSLTTGQS